MKCTVTLTKKGPTIRLVIAVHDHITESPKKMFFSSSFLLAFPLFDMIPASRIVELRVERAGERKVGLSFRIEERITMEAYIVNCFTYYGIEP